MSVPDRLSPKMRALLAEARMAERADVLAYVARKAINAGRLAKNNAATAESRELANDRRRQAEVLGDEITAGMHEGLAGVAADVPEAFGEAPLQGGRRMSGGLSLRSGPRGSVTEVEGGGFAVSERIEQSPLALVRRLVRYIRDDSTVRVRCVEQFGRAPSREQIAAIRAAENRARDALAARVEALPEKDCDALGFRPAPSGWVLREERRREAERARRALEAARQSLRADLRERERRAGMDAEGGVAADELIRMAAARHLLSHDDIVGRGRSRPVVRVRAMVCALLRLRGNSLPAIGRIVGGRDHSSVSHLLARWREGWCDEPGLAETFDELAVLVKPEGASDARDDQQQEAA